MLLFDGVVVGDKVMVVSAGQRMSEFNGHYDMKVGKVNHIEELKTSDRVICVIFDDGVQRSFYRSELARVDD